MRHLNAMEASARQRLIDDTERWFVRRGLPHAIDDYSAREDIFTRIVPFLGLVFVVEMLTTVFGDRYEGWGQAGTLLLALAGVSAIVVAINMKRGRRPFALPNDITGYELALFVFVPPVLALVFDGSKDEAIVLVIINTALVGLAFVFAFFGVLPMVRYGVQQAWHRSRNIVQLLARVLPLLVLFVTFLFMNAEMWQVASDFTVFGYVTIVAAIGLFAFGFVAARAPREIGLLAQFDSWEQVHALADQSAAPDLPSAPDPDTEPRFELDRTDRRNVSLLLFVSYAVQVVLIGIIITAAMVGFGALAVREETILQWTVQTADQIDPLASFTIAGERYIVVWEHLAVAGFIGVFAMLQFSVSLLTDETFREEFYADVSTDIREVLAVQALYIQFLARS